MITGDTLSFTFYCKGSNINLLFRDTVLKYLKRGSKVLRNLLSLTSAKPSLVREGSGRYQQIRSVHPSAVLQLSVQWENCPIEA